MEFIIDRRRMVALPFQKNPIRQNWLGFGGRHFVIRKAGGMLVHTNDLNVSNPDPKEDEPDNAVIVWSGGSGSGECHCVDNAKRKLAGQGPITEEEARAIEAQPLATLALQFPILAAAMSQFGVAADATSAQVTAAFKALPDEATRVSREEYTDGK